jgi:hypothetical protein
VIDLENDKKLLETFIVNNAHEAFISSELHKRTKRGILLHRKDARMILANNIKVNRPFFGIIIAEMEKKGLVEQNNQGIYIKEIGTENISGAVSKSNSA